MQREKLYAIERSFDQDMLAALGLVFSLTVS